ncbi:MAG: hypothetical protein Q9182_000880 [Xanthomendoza sp. 2 TL-2023]
MEYRPNIGHLEAAAGVAGIIKGVLSMEHGLIPPNIHFSKPNPAILLDEWNLAVPTKLTPWPATQHTRRMSVSGFGMGGTNGHVVLETLNLRQGKLINGIHVTHHTGKRLFVISSQDQAGFKRVGSTLVEHLDGLGPAASTPRYLVDLAHTLAIARSDLTWKATIVAENVADLRTRLSTEPGQNATRASPSQPRIGFVFTGQGAQWSRMGFELLERPVFRDSVSKSAAILKDLGCEWNPIKELANGDKESRLGVPEISQPICLILQIALIHELEAWGVRPSKVVGHSSGEIAAAYSIGALSHCDAVAAAFFRGKASAGLKNLKGGMMAVGCSLQQARKLLSEIKLTGGMIAVGCVNSPSSVTLSGDVAALEELRAILDKRGVFARRLKVDVAYHSTHMNAAFDEYSASIANIEPTPPYTGQPIMVSSVTGGEVDAELLGPYYWVRNLISTVLFADALKELVIPADGDGKNAVDLLIEIGPHSALGGPIEQILSHHGIKNVGYTSMLTRGENSLDCSLNLASDLFLHGVPITVQNANSDSQGRLLADLPPYPWNHSKTFRADSRIHRELITQQIPTRSLIGAQIPHMAENQHVWRSFIRLSEEPWLRGHTVGSTVLFPGAGIVSIVLEAAQQLVDPGKTARAFRLRDVNLFAAMALPEDQATEVIVHLRPHLIATSGSTPASWWEYTVSSCVGTDQLRDNSRGLVTIDYEENQSEQMVREDTRIESERIDDYHEILKACPDIYSKELFYQHMTKASWTYGELFQGVENCRPGYGKTTFDIRLVDVGETFSKGQLDRPFLINAASLDAVFQSWLGATYNNGAFEFDKPFVPTSIGEFEISAKIPADTDYIMPGLCQAERYGFNELSADIVCFDTDISSILLSVKDFRTSELEMDAGKSGGESLDVDPTDITSEIQWDHALHLLQPGEVGQVIRKISIQDRFTKLVRMVLHNNPAAAVIEVVSNPDQIPKAAMSNIAASVISPSQIRYAVSKDSEDNSERSTNHRDKAGQFLSLVGENENLLLADNTNASADMLVISHQAEDANDIEGLVSLARLQLAKHHAPVIVESSAAAAASLAAAHKGFEIVSSTMDGRSLALYNHKNVQSETNTNGVSKHEIVVIKPPTTSLDFASVLETALESRGFSVIVETWGADISSDDPKGKTFVSLLELEQPFLASISEKDFHNLRAVVLNCERLLWITYGNSPSFGMVDGFARCIKSEIASTNFQILHLSETTGLQHGPSLISQVLESESSDTEYREVEGFLQVARISKSLKQNDLVRQHLEDSVRTEILADQDEALRLTIGKPGLLDTLRLVSDERMLVPLQDHEVEIQVKATGLNFRDIMACMGLIPVRWLGQEASGIILQTGSKVTNFRPGDRVSTMNVGTHATRMRADHRVTAKIPDSMSFEEAAAVPVIHNTAYYAFVKVAKLRKGQSLLIHSAAGGVGQAAIQLAKHLDLVIYVTVGTEDKRRLLMEQYNIPEDHIFHSRDASFVKGIHRITGGRGVDCVLNSLSGELLRASWGCLATFGTFVEIGLRDITNNMRLDMRPFRKSTSFTFVNSHTLYEEDPETFYEVFDETFKLINQGILGPPTPVVAYPVSQVGEAFRIMQQGKHRGKLVLSFPDDAQAPVLRQAKDSLKLDPEATYLFVGGLGGLGRSLAKEFVASGARHIAFLSRSGDTTPQAKAIIDELTRGAVQVKAFRGDISDRNSFLAAMKQCSQELPPIKGVIQMAMVLRDVVFEKMTYEEWTVPVGPKVHGTWNLHSYFGHKRPLDFMIICSSTSGIYGYPSQAQYASGNTYQDALAQHRRSQGLKAISVNLGIMRDVGVLAETGTSGNIKLWEQVLGIREPAFHALMKSLITQQQRDARADCPVQVCTGLGTADIMITHGLALPSYFTDPRFSPLAITRVSASTTTETQGSSTAISLASRLGTASSKEHATEIITEALIYKTAEILQMPASEVDASRPLYRYGVDSLVALEVRNWITREMKANMALLEILAAVPIESFAGKIAEKSKLITVAA